MGLFGFGKGKQAFAVNYVAAKGLGALASLKNTLDSWDPEGSSEADIMGIDQQLNALTLEAGTVEEQLKKEAADVVRVRKEYNDKVGGLEVLQKRLETQTDPTVIAEYERVIEEELTALVELDTQLTVEIEEEAEKAAELADIKQVCVLVAERLKTARKTIEAGKTAAAKAERRVQKAEEMEARAKLVAGITKDMGTIGGALGAYSKKADEANAKAAALEMKASLLMPKKTNDLMADAMKEAAGTGAPKVDIKERLAALKKK